MKKVLLFLLMFLPIVSQADIGLQAPTMPKVDSYNAIMWLTATKAILNEVDPQVAMYIIDRESGGNPKALHKNDGKKGCDSRGLVQINTCYHAITDKQAYDVYFSIDFLIDNLSKGNCKKLWSVCPLHDS